MVSDQKGHSSRHESGGSDEIGLGGLVAADDTSINIGSDSDFQIQFDSGNNRFELVDNINDVDVFRVSPSSAFTLRNRNLDLSSNSVVGVDLVDGVDVSEHGSRHTDGSSDELDAGTLSGASGTNGQVLQTDGSAASWVDFQSGSDVSDDGSLVVAAPNDVNFGNQLDVSDDGDGSVTVDANVSTESTTAVSSSYTTSGETTIFVESILSTSYDTFDNGSSDSFSVSGDFDVNTNSAKVGSYSLELTGYNTGLNSAPLSSMPEQITVGSWVKIDTIGEYNESDATRTVYEFGSSVSSSSPDFIEDGIAFEFDSSSDIKYYVDESGTTNSGTLTSYSEGSWYRVEAVLDNANKTADIFVYDTNDNQIASATGVGYDADSSAQPKAFVGASTSAPGVTGHNCHWDRVAYSQGTSKLTLSSSDATDGKILRVVDANGNAGANSLTVDTEGSGTINGEPDAVLNSPYEALTFQSDGNDWFIVSRMDGGTV